MIACLVILTAWHSAVANTPSMNLNERVEYMQWIKVNPSGDIEDFLNEFKTEFPHTTLTVPILWAFRKNVLLGAVVPNWLHVALWQVAPDRDIETDPTLSAELKGVKPASSGDYEQPGALDYVAGSWLTFCINPSRSFRSGKFCHRVEEGPLSGSWVLSTLQFQRYMDFLLYRQLNEASKTSTTRNEGVIRLYNEFRSEPPEVDGTDAM